MKWITKLIRKQDGDTPKEALEKAITFVDNWCKENGFKYGIKHNEDTGCNRVLFIKTPHKTYTYKFIISVYQKPTGKFEEKRNMFFDYMYLEEITKPAYFAHLDK